MLRRSSLPLFLILSLFISEVSAHAFFVTGVITTTPTPAEAGKEFILQIEMTDPNQAPVEDAIIAAEFTKDGQISRFEFFPSGVAGLYSAKVTLPEEGTYSLLLRDKTYKQEEAKATVEFTLGPTQTSQIAFIFPPTRTGTNNLSTWLIWVIGIPVLAGIVVTVLVLLNTKDKDTDKEVETKQV
jgi:YtkA-like